MDNSKEAQEAARDKRPQDLVTEAGVRAALRADKGSEAHLTSWTVEDFTKPGDNYASFVSSVRVQFSQQGQHSEVVYVVKLNPCRHFELFEDVTRFLFMKEIKFHLTLVPELNSALIGAGQEPLRLPRCFHGMTDNGQEILFLEDLRPRGFKMADRKIGLDVAHSTLAMKELARLHASSLLLQHHNNTSEYYSLHHDYVLKDWFNCSANADKAVTGLYEGGLKSSVTMLEKVGGYEQVVSWIKGLRPKVREILDEQLGRSRYDVICHGDFWSNNLLFRYDEEGVPVEVMLLDFQMARQSSPCSDLNFFFYTSLTGEVRKPKLDSFLACYYNTFVSVMKAAHLDMPFTYGQFFQEFRDKNLYGAVSAMMVAHLIVMEPSDVPDMSSGSDFDEVLGEFHSKANELIDTSPLLRPRFLSVFDELKEVGLIP